MTSFPLWLAAETSCSYLEHRLARSIVVDPEFAIDVPIYSRLLAHGFRRSGNQVYKPHCQQCSACIPSRIPVQDFRPDRKQRRCLQRNQHTQVVIKNCEFDDRHYTLYQRYQTARHAIDNTVTISRDEYQQFFESDWCETWLVEFLIEGKLAAIAVVDVLDDALSAVYSFFAPEFNNHSPGVFAVLWQIEEARKRQLDYVYLGFWIKDCRKMSYKIQYQPLQGLIAEQWQPLIKSQLTQE